MTDAHNDRSQKDTSLFSSDEGWGLDKDIAKLEETPEEQLTSEFITPELINPELKRWDLVLVLLLLVIAVLVTLVGARQRGEALPFLPHALEPSIPTSQSLDRLTDGTELLLETDDERRRVFVRLPDRESWVLVSQDDFTAANPALSPDGAWVAYLSTQDAPAMVVVPLEQSGKVIYTSADLQGLGQRMGITMTSICAWTPIAWATDGARLAFFGCTDDPSASRAFFADLITTTMTLQPSLVAGSVASGDNLRQLWWNSSDQLSVTFPPTAPGEHTTVQEFSVPK